MIAHIIHLALRHKLLVFLTSVAICAAGVMSLTRLPIDAFPDISPNLVQVFAEIEGMAAEEVEQLVTRPVEIAMRGIPGVNKIRSLSSLGLSCCCASRAQYRRAFAAAPSVTLGSAVVKPLWRGLSS